MRRGALADRCWCRKATAGLLGQPTHLVPRSFVGGVNAFAAEKQALFEHAGMAVSGGANGPGVQVHDERRWLRAADLEPRHAFGHEIHIESEAS